MKPASFEYVRPDSLGTALDALSSTDARALAGGQSLVPLMNLRLAHPGMLVDINGLSELDHVAVDGYGEGGPGYICIDAAIAEGGYEPTASLVGPPSESTLKAAIEELLK